ncbi:hypothetical protein VTI74DRAFT_710 [Chaetomium olivicolor]
MDGFVYPPLPAGTDAIRILSVQPGDFYDPIICTLTPATFDSKPRYIALSYTWGLSYQENALLPTTPLRGRSSKRLPELIGFESPYERTSSTKIAPPGTPSLLDPSTTALLPSARTVTPSTVSSVTINGQPFDVHHNLHLALLHMRSSTHSLTLWIDAICINQEDIQERNAQVAIISFIYLRATSVLAWIGAKEYKIQVDLFRSMAMDWKTGQSRHLAETLSGAGKAPRYSIEPDHDTFVQITKSTYWRRLWIIQEVCLPPSLIFLYGSKIWAYEDMRNWALLKAPADYIDSAPMIRLLDVRGSRHTENMSLETLIEAFAAQACTEARDRVFGLLGMAVDARPFSDPAASITQDTPQPPGPAQGSVFGSPQTRRGRLKVDYARPFYDIWADVVAFVFSRPGKTEQYRDANEAFGIEPMSLAARCSFLAFERRLSIVRTAGVIQRALGQQVEEQPGSPGRTQAPPIRAMGYLAGEILEIGPECASLGSSFQAYQDWLDCRERHYRNSAELERLRRIDGEYQKKITSFEERDLQRIREIRNPSIIAWRAASGRQPDTNDANYTAEYDSIWATGHGEKESNEPRRGAVICLGTNHLICVVPPTAKVGDVVVRFWGCDAAMVMRPAASLAQSAGLPYMLVGRADVAEVVDRKATPGRDSHAEQALSGEANHLGTERDARASGPVFVNLDLPTLQMITASIAT